nr:MAG TPA: hypothetical protein [Caudoviricetes sp.]
MTSINHYTPSLSLSLSHQCREAISGRHPFGCFDL